MKLAVLFLMLILGTCTGQKNRPEGGSDVLSDGDSLENETDLTAGTAISGGNTNIKSATKRENEKEKNEEQENEEGENENEENENEANEKEAHEKGAHKKGIQNSDMELTLMVSELYSGIETAETHVIKDSKSLNSFYSQINRTRKPGLPVPEIDFTQQMLIVICSGIVQSGAVPIISVEKETENELFLKIGETSASSNSSAVTSPFSIYRMPQTDKKILIDD